MIFGVSKSYFNVETRVFAVRFGSGCEKNWTTDIPSLGIMNLNFDYITSKSNIRKVPSMTNFKFRAYSSSRGCGGTLVTEVGWNWRRIGCLPIACLSPDEGDLARALDSVEESVVIVVVFAIGARVAGALIDVLLDILVIPLRLVRPVVLRIQHLLLTITIRWRCGEHAEIGIFQSLGFLSKMNFEKALSISSEKGLPWGRCRRDISP